MRAQSLPIKASNFGRERGSVFAAIDGCLHVDGSGKRPDAGPRSCTGPHHLDVTQVFGIDRNVHQMMPGVGCAPTHPVHAQGYLLKRPPADAHIRLNAPSPARLHIDSGNEFQRFRNGGAGAPFRRIQNHRRFGSSKR